ncbi:hypothetical protein C2845_PM13G11830 [Panicum miliaceum]|uniref:F-box domain-containing protein n=1 Tax=Panicum miliaceum TaxID=4540 RepID=A0A3L6RF84_PANMI|nr:hypothetical protein C2845_PM13G11830 [Panicum miliaceum]
MAFPKNDGIMAAVPQEDRLSDLPDGVLGHVLSFLSAQEAARAAVLSRRYLRAFASVHTLSFVQDQGSSSTDAGSNDVNYLENVEKSRNEGFVALVDAAISCRRRCGGGDPGLRAFRVAFDSFHHSLAGDVDRWLSVATRGGAAVVDEIHVDARRQEQRACARERSEWYYNHSWYSDGVEVEIKDEPDGDDGDDFRNPSTRDRAYHVPRWLYSGGAAAASLRTLCLGSCFLDLPGGANLHFPSIETLTLIWIPDSGRVIQRLVSSCPRLIDLTLDSCRRVRAVTILNRLLRRLALRCCHGARLTMDASDLRTLEYRGPVPNESVLSFAGSPPTIVSCDIEFCGKMTSSEVELVNLKQFLGRFTDARWIRLGSSSMCSGIESLGMVPLPYVTQLELKGAMASSSAITAVTSILVQTPNLEILTLLILPDVDEIPRYQDAVICDPKVGLELPNAPPVNVVH